MVAGAGIITAFGAGWERNAEGFRNGRNAIREITLFDASRHRAKNAGQVDLPSDFSDTRLTKKHARRMDRAAQMLFHAASDAWRQAQWAGGAEIPIVLGTAAGALNLGEAFYRQAAAPDSRQKLQATRLAHYPPQRHGAFLHEAFDITGPVTVISNSCASSANAIGHAWNLIRHGHADRAIAGGYEALSPITLAGFDSLKTLSATYCRPFDSQRDGMTLGEGAAVLMLETLASAERRGAEILAEIVGYGEAHDGHHLTQPDPSGCGAAAAMRRACDSARVQPCQIDYLNAHGTGTPLNDSSEIAAILSWAGPGATRQLCVSSTKASIGHLLGAAGAAEAIVCLMSLCGQWLPPNVGVREVDELCAFRVVRSPTAARVEHALTNSFGFGGANASLLFRRGP